MTNDLIRELIFNYDIKYLDNHNFYSILEFLNASHVGLEKSRNEISNILITSLNSSSMEKSVISLGNIDYFSKLVLKENNRINSNTIKKELNTKRYKYDLIIVEPVTANLAAIAARDGRVDGIRISSESKLKIFNKRYGRRLYENGKFIELDLSCFRLQSSSVPLRPLVRIIKAMKNCKIPYILSIHSDSQYNLRSYRGLQSIGLLLGLSQNETSTKFLQDRLERNRAKISNEIPFEGVEVE